MSCTHSYTGRAHPSMRNMRPMAPPKERLMRAGRQAEREEEGGGGGGQVANNNSLLTAEPSHVMDHTTT